MSQSNSVGLIDLQMAHPRAQDRDRRAHRATKQQRAAVEPPLAFLGIAGRRFHSRLPKSSTSPVAGLRRSSASRDSATTTG